LYEFYTQDLMSTPAEYTDTNRTLYQYEAMVASNTVLMTTQTLFGTTEPPILPGVVTAPPNRVPFPTENR
jgi:hypothetical protein